MLISKTTYNTMNDLLASFFDANAIVDNLAYNLDFYYYNEIANLVHKKVAHKMPEFADEISDKMLQMQARPVRKAIGEYTEDINDLGNIFDVLYTTISNIYEDTRDLIKIADDAEDDNIRIFAEDLLEKIIVYVKQCDEWVDACKKLNANDMNIHICKYTHFIDISDCIRFPLDK